MRGIHRNGSDNEGEAEDKRGGHFQGFAHNREFASASDSCREVLTSAREMAARGKGRAGQGSIQRHARTSVAAKSSPLNSKGAFIVAASA